MISTRGLGKGFGALPSFGMGAGLLIVPPVSASASFDAAMPSAVSYSAAAVVSAGASVVSDLPSGQSYGPEFAGESYPLPSSFSYGAVPTVQIYYPGRYFSASGEESISVLVGQVFLAVEPPDTPLPVSATGGLATLAATEPAPDSPITSKGSVPTLSVSAPVAGRRGL